MPRDARGRFIRFIATATAIREPKMQSRMKKTLAAAAVASLAATAAAPALAIDKNARDAFKLGTSGVVAKTLAEKGLARVIVNIATMKTGMAIEADLASPATRATAKAQIAGAVANVVGRHFGAAPKINGHALTRFTTLPGFAVTVNGRQLQALLADPAVASIEEDKRNKLFLDVSTPTIGMPAAWTNGATGANRTTVVIDTGVDRNHPFITAARVVREGCFLIGANCPNGANEQTGAGASYPNSSGDAHGTHVAGIAMGKNTVASATPASGVAKMAKLFAINVFETDQGAYDSSLIRALEYVEDEHIATPSLGISSINMSLGGGNYGSYCDAVNASFNTIVLRLRYSYNIPLVAAAGNDDYGNQMGWPACISNVVSVGATNRAGNAIAFYSSLTSRTTLLAPGGDSQNGGSVVSSVLNNAYAGYQGTSMASPHVAGVLAALRSKYPAALTWRIEDALRRTGVVVTDNRSTGYGVKLPRIAVDAARAFIAAPTAPTNNNFASAATIANIAAETWGSTSGATREAGEPAPFSAAGPSIWWKWTPSVSGQATLSTMGSNFDTVLGVYTGTAVNALTQVAISDNTSAATRSSAVSFQATAGVTYRIYVAGKLASSAGAVRLIGASASATSNNDFANARTASVSSTAMTLLTGANVGATVQAGEPTYHGINSVWWKFVAPSTGAYTIDTESSMAQNGAPLDTMIAVYTGTVLNSLTLIGSDDEGGYGSWSKLTFNATQGTTYYLAVGAYNLGQGPQVEQGSLRIHIAPPGFQYQGVKKVAAQ